MSLPLSAAVREAVQSARAHRGTTIVLALVAMAMVAVTFFTAGRAAAAEAEIASQVDAAGPRLVTATVLEPSPGLLSDAVARIAAIPEAEWVLALGEARDVRSTAAGERVNVAARALLTPLPGLVTIEPGRTPRRGEAIIGTKTQQRLQLIEPSGSLLDGSVARPVVGRFSAEGVVGDLERLVLVAPLPGEIARATLVYVLASDASAVPSIEKQIKAPAGVPDEPIAIETAPELIELGVAVSGTIGALGRQLAIGAIAVGMVLAALTMTLALNNRRRDFGRRRALGSSRTALLGLTLLEAGIPILLGTVVGAGLSAFGVLLLVGSVPPIEFVLAASALVMIAGVAAAVPPAAIASAQDPLRILRVP